MYALGLWHQPYPPTASSHPNLRLENSLEVKPERTIVVYAGFNGGPHHQQLEVAGAHLDFIVAATDASHPTPL